MLAHRLSEDPAVRVLVLEAGPPDWHPYIHIPAGFIKTLNNVAYADAPDATLVGLELRPRRLREAAALEGLATFDPVQEGWATARLDPGSRNR